MRNALSMHVQDESAGMFARDMDKLARRHTLFTGEKEREKKRERKRKREREGRERG